MVMGDALDALSGATRGAVIDLLYRLGDDELIIGHSGSARTAHAPTSEEDTAFSSILRLEIEHAFTYYELLHRLGEPDPETLAYTRKPRQYRCASLVCLPDEGNWQFCVLRQFLYDTAETVRLSALAEGALTPLAQLARRLRDQEVEHLSRGRTWVLRLGGAAGDSLPRMRAALHAVYPHALGLFEPTEADEPLAQAGVCLHEEELRRRWESAVVPVIADAGLEIPEAVQPVYGGRVGRHPEALGKLLDDMRRARSCSSH